jgi:phage terminase large subunit
MAIVEFALRYPGTRYLIGRKQLNELRQTTINTLRWFIRTHGFGEYFQTNDKGDIYNTATGTVTLTNGSEILLRPLDIAADAELVNLSGLDLTAAWIDEASEVEGEVFSKLIERLRLLPDGAKPWILVTTNPHNGWCKEKFYDPAQNGTLPSDYAFIPAFLTDNPNLPAAYVRNMNVANLGERRFREMVLGDWNCSSDSGSLFTSSDIHDCFQYGPEGKLPGSEKILSIDPAGQGKDSTVISRWTGYECEEIITLQGATHGTILQRVRQLQQDHNISNRHVVIDVSGNVNGVQDSIPGCVKFTANSRPLGTGTNYGNIKDQLVFTLASLIKDKRLRFGKSCEAARDRLIEEAVAHRDEAVDMDGKRRVTRKDEVKRKIKRSPDAFDSIYMRMWFHLQPRSYRTEVWSF